jgi:hypothetical protein
MLMAASAPEEEAEYQSFLATDTSVLNWPTSQHPHRATCDHHQATQQAITFFRQGVTGVSIDDCFLLLWSNPSTSLLLLLPSKTSINNKARSKISVSSTLRPLLLIPWRSY